MRKLILILIAFLLIPLVFASTSNFQNVNISANQAALEVSNSSGGRVLIVNTTSGQTEFWHPAEGTNDYVRVYHDGTDGYFSTASGVTYIGNAGTNLGWDATRLYPVANANVKDLGLISSEWRALYLGNGTSSGIYFDMAQASTLLMSYAQVTAPTMVWGLPAGTNGHSLILASNTFLTDDYDHPSQVNPTLFVQANIDPDTTNVNWTSISHDGTSAVIDSGSDKITLDDTTNIAGNLNLGDNVVGVDKFRICYNGTESQLNMYSANNSLWSCSVNNSGSFLCAGISTWTCT